MQDFTTFTLETTNHGDALLVSDTHTFSFDIYEVCGDSPEWADIREAAEDILYDEKIPAVVFWKDLL